MKTFEYTITDPVGIHARPAGLEHASKVTITKKNPDGTEKSADAKKLLALMNLGIKQGDTVTVSVDGEDEDDTFEAISRFMSENL